MFEGRYSRRRFLSTAGVTVTLPMWPSLLWSRKGEAATCAPVKRFLAYHFPNGHHMIEHVDATEFAHLAEPGGEVQVLA